tara:strand:- start:4501 stop:5214 length:714 start_codon:yes stop_codon:yes gene_type:complete
LLLKLGVAISQAWRVSVEVYKTEEEQLDSIKSWIKSNGIVIIIAIVGIIGVFGGRAYWQSYTHGNYESTYIQFEQVRALRDAALAGKAGDEAFNAYVAGIDDLKQANPDHALTDLAVLKLAADFADKKRWDEAENELRWLESQQVEPALESLVLLRLSQVLFQKNQYDEALTVISKATSQDDDYLPRLKELEGDIYVQQKQLPKAKASYEAAANANIEKGLSSPALQWKIDDLTGVE